MNAGLQSREMQPNQRAEQVVKRAHARRNRTSAGEQRIESARRQQLRPGLAPRSRTRARSRLGSPAPVRTVRPAPGSDPAPANAPARAARTPKTPGARSCAAERARRSSWLGGDLEVHARAAVRAILGPGAARVRARDALHQRQGPSPATTSRHRGRRRRTRAPGLLRKARTAIVHGQTQRSVDARKLHAFHAAAVFLRIFQQIAERAVEQRGIALDVRPARRCGSTLGSTSARSMARCTSKHGSSVCRFRCRNRAVNWPAISRSGRRPR